MSHAPIPLAEELVSKFKGQTIAQSIRFYKCVIRDEVIVNTYEERQTSNMEADWGHIAEQAGDEEPAYFIVRLEGTKRWLLLTYVPDAAPVKSKMTFASAKEFLKEKLGANFFVEDVHATTKAELSYANLQAGRAPVNALSSKEVELGELHKQEEQARKDFSQSLTAKTQPGATAGIGGYHSVVLPLTDHAKAELTKLREGTATFLELEITEKNDHVEAKGTAKNVNSGEGVAKEITGSAPRFYVYLTNKISKQAALIYYCPGNSPQKLRMVYSTAKQGLADEINRTGLHIASRKIEISEAGDVVEELKRNLNANTGLQPAKTTVLGEGGGVVKAKNIPTIGGHGGNAHHSVYGLMNNSVTQKTEVKKKIVMPPPGAYG
ncbi:twinfilin-1 [Planoprotostelium fungivorum]|uniref:Twinfilin-1 n=1 Tax=Planoprotostelium fungivorum TaxID=1890364 RepID=A0A2P6NGZ1_9EUKA|nr:twinfilin-1 [Planoprotostelium fungivorum]